MNLKDQETYLAKWYQNIGKLEYSVFQLLAKVRGGNSVKK